jgi:hypothetical protein
LKPANFRAFGVDLAADAMVHDDRRGAGVFGLTMNNFTGFAGNDTLTGTARKRCGLTGALE